MYWFLAAIAVGIWLIVVNNKTWFKCLFGYHEFTENRVLKTGMNILLWTVKYEEVTKTCKHCEHVETENIILKD